MKSRSFKRSLGVGTLALGATIVQFSSVNPAVAGLPAGKVTVRVDAAIATAVSQVHNEQLSAYASNGNTPRASANRD